MMNNNNNPQRNSYQTGWIRELPRDGGEWTAFKLCWRERDATNNTGACGSAEPRWVERSRVLPRYRSEDGKPTLRKHAEKELKLILAPINASAEARAIAGRISSSPLVVHKVTFNGLLDLHWDDYVSNQKLRRSTQDGYVAMLENWIKPFFGDMLLSQITKATVGEFFASLRAEGLSDQYQKNIYGLLHKLFELAEAFELIQSSPINKMLHRPHVERGEKPALPVGKVKAFFEALP
jgi:hypothetical protein